ncbi:MAG: 3'(2'),5'-bisphosphate nucleotidase CysQ, partial [Acidimicrobiales bacterium]|nr:3'(2'),5'-bisphosphate nucleotidase CysQ [Acidimicrobiales bacterium]
MSDTTATADDHALAIDLARSAGELLLEVRERLVADGAPSSELKRAGDEAAHRLLMERLAAERPDDGVLSEEGSGAEGPSGTRRLGTARTWIVDPLDGTREFS